MCGIVGYFGINQPCGSLKPLFEATRLIAHRGPDDEGYAVFNTVTGSRLALCGPDSPPPLHENLPVITEAAPFPHHAAFGFRRFSIVDLSERGHQPFWNHDKSVCLIFNGEIYNYIEVRRELEQLGYTFQTTCDTEVLMVGYQAWGMDVLTHCNGPIALALYDQPQQQLFLARDRMGKSPLYYTVRGGTLYWASEIKSILHLASNTAFTINDQAVYDYLNYGLRDVNNGTFWQGIRTLDAATWTFLDTSKPVTEEQLLRNRRSYWDFPAGRLDPGEVRFDDARDHFRSLFMDAVRIRARADAKVAFSLSGGLDSSSIVAAAANMAGEPFRTYSIKFPGEKQDEEPLARSVYARYPDRIDYHTYTPTNMDFWQVAGDYIWLQEEPFHFPNAELFQAYFRQARTENYKVMIVGAGGDELMAGYRDFFFPLLYTLRQQKRFMPMVSNLFMYTSAWSTYRTRKRLKVLKSLILNQSADLISEIPVSFFNASGIPWAHRFLKDTSLQQHSILNQRTRLPQFHEMTVGYMSNWLMNYWHRNGNKSHFGVPMETRSPFMDYRLIEYVFALPPEYLVNRGWTKFLLRKSVDEWLPRPVIWNRKKQGLPFNTQSWFSDAKPIIEKHVASVYNNPYIDTNALMAHYDELLHRQPLALWRAVNFCLWWKRVIRKELL